MNQGIKKARELTLTNYAWAVKQYNHEKQTYSDLPSSVAVQAYLRGLLMGYRNTLKNLRLYREEA